MQKKKEISAAELNEPEEIKFFLPMIPPTITNQEHRILAGGPGKRPIIYDSPALKEARMKFTAHLSRHAPDQPFTGPVRLVTKWLFPATKSHKDQTYKHTKPDTDNLIKLFKDCMTRCGYWKDDAQVASEITEKFWYSIPGIYVYVMRLPDQPLLEPEAGDD